MTLSWKESRKRAGAAGLDWLCAAYGIEVRPWISGHKRDSPDPDYFTGPTIHDLSFKAKILWFHPYTKGHHDWLHEIAHIVCSPPWEESPKDSFETGAIFGWELAVAKAFRRRRLWTAEEFDYAIESNNAYGMGNPPFNGGRTNEWGDMQPDYQLAGLSWMNRTLRLCGLLNANNYPTWKKPHWPKEAEERWRAVDEDWARVLYEWEVECHTATRKTARKS